MSKTVTREISIGDVGTRGSEATEKADSSRMALNVGPSHPTTHGFCARHGVERGVMRNAIPSSGICIAGTRKSPRT